MLFEWSEAKEKYNINKHGLSFSVASRVFADQNRIEKYDERHSEEEERYITIGTVHGSVTVITVSYTPRKDAIRIISARKADHNERKEYERNVNSAKED